MNMKIYAGIWAALAVCFVLFHLTCMPPHAGAQTGGRVAFAAYRDGRWDVYSVSVDGGDLRRLTNDPAEDDAPAYSPDGGKIAYASRRGGNWDIYLLDLASGAETRLTTSPEYDGAPAWKPDGTQIAYESYASRDLDVWLVDSAGGEPVNLTGENPGGDFGPTWTPDGKRVVYSSWGREDMDIMAVDPATGETEQWTNTPTAEDDPAFSVDGGRLAYVVSQSGMREVFTADAAALPAKGGAYGQVTWLGRADSPLWLPGGSLLVVQYREEGARIVRIEPGEVGDVPRSLTRVSDVRGPLTWSAGASAHGEPVESPSGGETSSLYVEDITPSESSEGEPWDILPLDDTKLPTPDMSPYLSDTVDDSFLAMRARVRDEVGYDFLGELSEALRPRRYFGEFSEYASWHKSGRAIDTLFSWTGPDGAMMELARDDMAGETYWRVYLRCTNQDGSCGRPLTRNTWNLSSEARTELGPGEGGVEKQVPYGYYVDFTALAHEYGWERISAWSDEEFGWTWHFKALEYWHFQKSPGYTWYDSMLEVYPEYKLKEDYTWEKMRGAEVPPYHVALKAIPLPPEQRAWWDRVRP